MATPTPDPLAPLVEVWLRSDDPDRTLASLCREHPEQADALQARMADLIPTQAVPSGAQPATPPASVGDAHPSGIGPYKLLEILGEGGMGTVYLAEQTEPVRRRVALKLIKLGMDSAAVVQRFEQERQALALMDHEGIAKVFDCGTSERGQPFFVMELVKGVPLDSYCEQNRLSLTDRLDLMQQVCAAVQHAHQKGVIHRDLKPGNVLVGDVDGKLQVKIIDFGLAKAMGQKLIEESLFTEIGTLLGTPEYMAPEQADLSNLDIDTRADVYSLGVMLYQLLVGELPFSGEQLRAAGWAEMQRVLREVEPQRPSTRLSTQADQSTAHAKQLRISASALRRALKGDLDWVVVKALEKDRNRRYDSANALAADLQRFLDHEPLQAGPPSAVYRLQKLLRRHRLAFTTGSVVAAALLLSGVGIAVALADSERSRSAMKSALTKFDLLAIVQRLDRATELAKPLFPAWPEQREELTAWITQHGEPLASELPVLEAAVVQLEQAIATGDAAQWENDPRSNAMLLSLLRKALPRLRDFVRDDKGALLSVRRRLAWVDETVRKSLGSDLWPSAIAAVRRSDRYGGLELVPQVDLVPLGPDPTSGMHEFLHLPTHAAEERVPVRDVDGRLQISETTGLVFVLLPGGDFVMGSAPDDETRENDEPLQDVWLSPFFLSKCEMTQAQWERLSMHHASYYQHNSWYRPGNVVPQDRIAADGTRLHCEPFTSSHPVEGVTWRQCTQLMSEQGLNLPTEAQWEYSCRAGSSATWSTGAAAESLRRTANLADRSAAEFSDGMIYQWCDWNDGWPGTAVVGSFEPNLFGLHDMHGNVYEWCQDVRLDPALHPLLLRGTGLRDATGVDDEPLQRTFRGGSFQQAPKEARCANRQAHSLDFGSTEVGLRPARRVFLP